MKYLMFLLIPLLLITACNNRDKFGFSSSNCDEVYTNCMNKCTQGDKTKADCLVSCSKSRNMCYAVKVKGCMQDCNKHYGKDTPGSKRCKQACVNNRGNT